MKKLLSLSVVATLLMGCSAAMQPAKEVSIPHQFDLAQVQKQLESGKETLKGNAFLRQKGGGTVNCAGATVDLYPYTPYSMARIEAQYPFDMWIGGRFKSKDTFVPVVPQFETLKKTTTCDSEGNFEFDSLKDGSYIVVTEVVWHVPGKYGMERQGGYLFKNVSVNKGNKSKVIITQ
ncbi:hypothetical protein BMT54_06415 [Pasteurellaceae bacterium 15-036681]|nr:hypothetical protein BMT54_06415 [Pasteurellaceae bacterium 15-036681]